MARARVSFSAALDSYAHDQGDDGTCYAHTVATLIISALRRMGAQAIPDRSVVLQQTISRFGPDGANTEEVLTWAVGIYIEPARRVLHQDGRLEDGQAAAVTVVSAHEVDDIVQQDEAKVAMCFRVSPGQWNKLTRFFERNPMGILSAQDLGPAEARRTEGHAVVIENLEDYDHGGSGRISSRHFWRIKNSWGVGHGTLGSVHVSRDALSVHFFTQSSCRCRASTCATCSCWTRPSTIRLTCGGWSRLTPHRALSAPAPSVRSTAACDARTPPPTRPPTLCPVSSS